MYTRRLALTLALLGAALPALAQEGKPAAAPAAKPDAAKAAEAKPAPVAAKPAATELARILMPRKTWADGLEQLGQMVQMRLTMHPGASTIEYPKDMPAKVKVELETALPYEDLVGMHARELTAAYSDGELGDLIAFYKSPTGQKSLVKMADVQNKVGLETQQRVESKMPDIMKRLSATAKVTPAKEGAKKDAPAGQKPPGHP